MYKFIVVGNGNQKSEGMMKIMCSLIVYMSRIESMTQWVM